MRGSGGLAQSWAIRAVPFRMLWAIEVGLGPTWCSSQGTSSCSVGHPDEPSTASPRCSRTPPAMSASGCSPGVSTSPFGFRGSNERKSILAQVDDHTIISVIPKKGADMNDKRKYERPKSSVWGFSAI